MKPILNPMKIDIWLKATAILKKQAEEQQYRLDCRRACICSLCGEELQWTSVEDQWGKNGRFKGYSAYCPKCMIGEQ